MKAPTSAQRISVAAMLVALSCIISSLPSLPGPITKFSGFPLLLGGMLIGPRTAFAVGCLTDIIGFAIRPTGAFFPGFTLTQALTAAIPALIAFKVDPLTWRKLSDEDPNPVGGILGSYLRLLLIFGLAQLVTSVLMVSFFVSKVLAGTPLVLELTHRGIAQAIHVPIYAMLALMVLKSLSQTELYRKLLVSRR